MLNLKSLPSVAVRKTLHLGRVAGLSFEDRLAELAGRICNLTIPGILKAPMFCHMSIQLLALRDVVQVQS